MTSKDTEIVNELSDLESNLKAFGRLLINLIRSEDLSNYQGVQNVYRYVSYLVWSQERLEEVSNMRAGIRPTQK